MNQEDIEIVKRTSLFKQLLDDDLRKIVGNESPRNYAKGKIIFQQGDDAHHFYVVLAGWVKLYRQFPSGEQAILHIFTNGETFAEAAMFGDHRYPATAEVVSDARLLPISCGLVERQLQESPRVAMSMLASTTLHMRDLVKEVEQVKGRNSVQRLAHFLVKMCPSNTRSAVVKLPYEKALIASRLGIQPESLSRVLNKLRGYGANCIKDQIIISDIGALRRLASGDD